MRAGTKIVALAAALIFAGAAAAQTADQHGAIGEPLAKELRMPHVHRYRRTCAGFRYPAIHRYRFGMGPDLRRLDRLATPVTVPDGIPVEAPLGVWAGRIRRVDVVQGRAKWVVVALDHCVTTRLRASSVRYDPASRVAFIDVTRSQLWDMPSDRVHPTY